MNKLFYLIDKLEKDKILTKEEFIYIIDNHNEESDAYLFEKSRKARERVYGKDVYIRGLIEFTNICKNNCYYCGIRAGATKASRYRLTKEEILECCDTGYRLGFRTFVLQGGEDLGYQDEDICEIVRAIKDRYRDVAITLSIGEKERSSYKAYYDAGATRYLLRHETASKSHYEKLHPDNMSFDNRMRCLKDLKDIGYQVGCGFMVGSPYQTSENLAEDLLFIADFKPHMVGIGPFISHHDTPFADKRSGTLSETLTLLGLIRLINNNVLLPATTALGTINENGRELGILAGSNVVMPNLSPKNVREKYLLYDNKICTGDEAAESVKSLAKRVENIGYKIVVDRGDYRKE